MRIVVVGASLGGLRTVEALRRAGVGASVLLVGAEALLPYDRPPLSKDFLRGTRHAGDLALAKTEHLAELEVEVRLGTVASSLDTAGKAVLLADGSREPYDVLVIATGSRARRLPGSESIPGVHTLRTLADATALRKRLGAGGSLVVVGGGFIGSEVAATAVGMGLRVTIVEPAGGLMVRALGPTLGEHMTDLHRRHGIEVRLEAGVAGIAAEGTRQRVDLTDGTSLCADTTVVGVGAEPEIGWLEGSGLGLADGVVCGPDLRAVGTDGVFAVGDVARWLHPRYGREIRVEHWTNVTEHAAVVAAGLAGRPSVADALPYVWSDQLGARLQVAGIVPPDPSVDYVVGGPGDERFVALLAGDDRLSAVVARGSLRDFLAHRRELDRMTAAAA